MKAFKSKKIILIILSMIVVLVSATHFLLNKNKSKILLIGIDGADWKVIMPLVNQGKLPNIKQLMDKGCWGKLESVYPLTSEVVWTSIFTGKSLDKHGITSRLMKDPDTEELVPPTSNLVKVKRIWNILSEYKRKIAVIGHKITWPPEEVNGVMVSDRIDIHRYEVENYSYPPFGKLCSEIEFKNFSKVKNSIFSRIEKETIYFNFDYSAEELDNFIVNISNYLLQNKKFDFFTLYLSGTDKLSHHFWEYLFPEGFKIGEEKRQRYKDIINDYYIFCDRAIGGLLKEIDKDTTVIIVSDHGFRSVSQKGYIFYKLNLLLELCNLNKFRKNSKEVSIKYDLGEYLDTQRCLRIYGDLSKEEFKEIREEAKEILKNIKVKETNYGIFNILEDTKNGFIVNIDYYYIYKYPQHHLLIKNKEYKILDFLYKHPFCGSHDPLGIIILSGKDIYQNKQIETATIYDIAPTILYLTGLPVAKDMKGKVLSEAIDDNFLRRYPIRYIDTYEIERKKKPQKPVRSPEDEERIKERMRSLGYIQ